MKWGFIEPKKGDMIRVKLGSIYHYGIYVSDDNVVQFGLHPSLRPLGGDELVEVCSSTIDDFLGGGFLEVGIPEKKDGKKKNVDDVVAYAESKIGERGYNILYNNCEHFAYESLFGKKICTQTDDLRSHFKKMFTIDVYVALIPEAKKVGHVYPKERDDEIFACTSEKVKRQKYFVWKLLEYAILKTFGKKIDDVSFTKKDNGKWTADGFEFSLSHSENVVTVAVSKFSVGVDIEVLDAPKEGAIERVLTDKEKADLDSKKTDEKDLFLLEKWSQKESLFKMGKYDKFTPSSIETTGFSVKSKVVKVGEKDYVLTVASIKTDSINYLMNVSL